MNNNTKRTALIENFAQRIIDAGSFEETGELDEDKLKNEDFAEDLVLDLDCALDNKLSDEEYNALKRVMTQFVETIREDANDTAYELMQEGRELAEDYRITYNALVGEE